MTKWHGRASQPASPFYLSLGIYTRLNFQPNENIYIVRTHCAVSARRTHRSLVEWTDRATQRKWHIITKWMRDRWWYIIMYSKWTKWYGTVRLGTERNRTLFIANTFHLDKLEHIANIKYFRTIKQRSEICFHSKWHSLNAYSNNRPVKKPTVCTLDTTIIRCVACKGAEQIKIIARNYRQIHLIFVTVLFFFEIRRETYAWLLWKKNVMELIFAALYNWKKLKIDFSM